jgi:ribosomal protein L22
MKAKHILFVVLLTTISTASYSQFLKNLEKSVGINPGSGGGFTQDEAARAIKEALSNGIVKGVDKVSVADGYFKNPSIKIPFPPEAQKVEDALRGIGLGNMVDNAVSSMNHAAENAAKAATNIFLNAIKQMTLNDAINIVNNKQQDAATQFLQRTTTDQLVAAFKPSIKDALDKTGATKYWSDVMTEYNKIPFVSKVETDLPEYATRKAIAGLFYMVAKEEANIRKDPLARTSDLLKKVFGNVKN